MSIWKSDSPRITKKLDEVVKWLAHRLNARKLLRGRLEKEDKSGAEDGVLLSARPKIKRHQGYCRDIVDVATSESKIVLSRRGRID